ncbi:hypothetical protein P885DRAFT_57445 [Corynascus similis CBS 632.67]
MTSYGGYQRTGYGTQGGDDGGGFMSASQQGSQGGGGSGKKNFENDTLRPVTIKQIIDWKEAFPNAEPAIDGLPTSQVTLIGQVRSAAQQAVNITFRIDDGTGQIDVKKWFDADKPDSMPHFDTNTYVRVYGLLQSFNGKRHILAHSIRAIVDFNEVNCHLLEATYVHLALTRGAGVASGDAGQQQQGDDSMFVDGGYGAGGGGAGGGTSGSVQARLALCSKNARTIFSCLANAPGTDGMHLTGVASATGLSPKDVMAGAEELVAQGVIYTTQDDETWAILDF